MLRRSLFLMLLWALLAGPAFGAHSGDGYPACEQASMAIGGSGDCGDDHGVASNACTMHCGATVAIATAMASVQLHIAAQAPVAQPALQAGDRANPPDTAPPKA